MAPDLSLTLCRPVIWLQFRFGISSDAFVQGCSLAGRLKAHLLREHPAAGFVLGESRAALARARVQTHCLPVALFVPRLKLQLPHCEAQRLLVFAYVLVVS